MLVNTLLFKVDEILKELKAQKQKEAFATLVPNSDWCPEEQYKCHPSGKQEILK